METLGGRIRQRRMELGLTQLELAQRLGYKSKTSITKIESDVSTLNQPKIIAFAKALNTTPAYLMGWDQEPEWNVEPASLGKNFIRVPVLGRVAAGIPIESISNVDDDDFEDIPVAPGDEHDYFALRIKGDSMVPMISDESVVIVKVQPDAESGDVVIATVNGDDATCKRLKKFDGGIMLLSENPAYNPMIFRSDDIKSLPVRILGKVIEVRTRL